MLDTVKVGLTGALDYATGHVDEGRRCLQRSVMWEDQQRPGRALREGLKAYPRVFLGLGIGIPVGIACLGVAAFEALATAVAGADVADAVEDVEGGPGEEGPGEAHGGGESGDL